MGDKQHRPHPTSGFDPGKNMIMGWGQIPESPAAGADNRSRRSGLHSNDVVEGNKQFLPGEQISCTG